MTPPDHSQSAGMWRHSAKRLRLGALVTHPVQYHAPLFRALAAESGVDLRVYYAHAPTPEEQGIGFGVPFSWDTDLTTGYDSIVLSNRAAKRARGFWGYDTPDLANELRREWFHAFVLFG